MPWIILGVGMAAACALGGAVVLSSAGQQRDVLVAAHAVPAGHVITAGDLRLVSMSAPGVALLESADEEQVLGHTAAVPLAAGAPLVGGDVGNPGVAAGTALVAVLVKAGQYPPSLQPGQRVAIVDTTADASTGTVPVASSSGPAAARTGTVLAIDTPSDAAISGTVVTLQVATDDAAAVAQAGAAGHVSLVAIPVGR